MRLNGRTREACQAWGDTIHPEGSQRGAPGAFSTHWRYEEGLQTKARAQRHGDYAPNTSQAELGIPLLTLIMGQQGHFLTPQGDFGTVSLGLFVLETTLVCN